MCFPYVWNIHRSPYNDCAGGPRKLYMLHQHIAVMMRICMLEDVAIEGQWLQEILAPQKSLLALLAIYKTDGISVSRLQEAIGSKNNRAGRSLADHFVAHGLATITESPRAGGVPAVTSIHLTPIGRALASRVQPLARDYTEPPNATPGSASPPDWPAERRRATLDILRAFLERGPQGSLSFQDFHDRAGLKQTPQTWKLLQEMEGAGLVASDLENGQVRLSSLGKKAIAALKAQEEHAAALVQAESVLEPLLNNQNTDARRS